MTVATITSKGQVTIPKGVRKILGLKAGDKIDFIVTVDGSVLVKPCAVELDEVQGMLQSAQRLSVEDMDKAVAAFHTTRSGKRSDQRSDQRSGK